MSIIPLYAAAATQAIAKGDLAELKKVAAEAEKHIHEYGDVPTLLQYLRVEIAKVEAGKH